MGHDNKGLRARLEAMHAGLNAAVAAGESLSSSSRGAEREAVMGLLVRTVVPPSFRCGSGDVIDVHGVRSGQLDLVLENGFCPSFPFFGDHPRLYIAEGVAAAVEVKSNLRNQWDEVEVTHSALSGLRRSPRRADTSGVQAIWLKQVPLVVVGYRGWKTAAPIRAKLQLLEGQRSSIAAVLQIEPPLFVPVSYLMDKKGVSVERVEQFFEETTDAAASIFEFIRLVQFFTNAIRWVQPPLRRYDVSRSR